MKKLVLALTLSLGLANAVVLNSSMSLIEGSSSTANTLLSSTLIPGISIPSSDSSGVPSLSLNSLGSASNIPFSILTSVEGIGNTLTTLFNFLF